MEIPGGTAGELSVGLQGTDPRFARQLERSIYRRSDLSKLDARNASPISASVADGGVLRQELAATGHQGGEVSPI